MLKRLIVGLFLGAVVGAVLAAALVQGLGVITFDAWSLGAAGAYLAAAITGVITGLVAGKPIWSAGGKVEAGLKAFFGALIALGGMFALRHWVHVPVDLTSINASRGPTDLGQLPAVTLPIIAAVLGAFFELDNTEPKEQDNKGEAAGGRAVARADKKVRVAGDAEDEDPEDVEDAAPAKNRR